MRTTPAIGFIAQMLSPTPVSRRGPAHAGDLERGHTVTPTGEYDVAIVGYGPVGALLANLLGQRGLKVAVFERDAAVNPLPRAVHFDGEVMRIFQGVGLADRISSVARASSKGMHFVNAEGKTLLVRRGREGPGPHGWASNWYFHQPFLEEELRLGVERFANVDVMLRHDVYAIDQHHGGAVIRAEDMSCGGLISARAKYVVGCDGARSLVRRLIGSTMDDLGLHQPWLVVDLLVDDESERVKALPDYTIQLCDPARPMTSVYVGGNRRRWEIMLLPGDDAKSLTEPRRMWQLLSRWVQPPDGAIERSALYTFHSVVARTWRGGRLLLAGDSCHQTPPFLGQGMCAGMRDAANLSWKLAAVLSGRADESLLDTYETERRPHVEAFIRLAVELGGLIQTTDIATAQERDRQFAEGGAKTFDYPQPQLGAGMREGGPPPAGSIFPQPRLADGRLLDEATTGRFAIIADERIVGAIEAGTMSGMRALDTAVVTDMSAPLAEALEALGAAAVVLRPDNYIFGIARNAAELSALSARLFEQMSTHAPPQRSVASLSA